MVSASYECAVRELRPQRTLSIRGPSTPAALGATIGEFLAEVWTYIAEHGGGAAGPPFTRYHAVEGGVIDLEAGLPIAAALPGHGRVRPGTLPGGTTAVTSHVGPYAGLADAGAALDVWAGATGFEAAGPGWTVYVTDPAAEPDSAKWRTEVYKPLRAPRVDA